MILKMVNLSKHNHNYVHKQKENILKIKDREIFKYWE